MSRHRLVQLSWGAVLLLGLATALCPRRAHAFDSKEHCAISNLAAQLAFDYARSQIVSLHPDADRLSEEPPEQISDPAASFLAQLKRARKEFLSGQPSGFEAHPPVSMTQLCAPTDWPMHVSNVPFSYGKLVALVDFTLDPWSLFQLAGTSAQWHSVIENLNPDFRQPPGHRNVTQLFRYLLASHNNPRHFQGQALDEFYGFHDAALAAAREDATDPQGSLLRTLAYGAVADHFLEDSFAPGHNLTPRDGMYDAVALSWHDAFNDRGRVIAVRHWSELKPLSDFAERDASQLDAGFRTMGGKPQAHRGEEEISLRNALTYLAAEREHECFVDTPKGLQAIFEHFMDPEAEDYSEKLDLNTQLLSLFPDSVDSTRAARMVEEHASGAQTAETLTLHPSETDSERYFCVHGDGSLSGGVFHTRAHDRSDSTAQHDLTADRPALEIAEQKALMLLVESKYILDRLAAFADQRKVSWREVETARPMPAQADWHLWCPMMRATALVPDASKAPDKPCKQVIEQAAPLCKQKDKRDACAQVVLLPTAVTRYFAFVSTPNDEDVLAGATLDYRDYVYAVHVGEVPSNRRVAPVAGLEIGFPDVRRSYADTDGDMKPFPWTLFGAIGWEWHLADRPQNSQALTLRLMTQFPSIDSQAGVYGKLEDLGDDITRRWRWGYGLRLDQGFSLFSLYVLLGWEPTLNDPVRTTKGFAVGTGLSMSVNGRRIARAVTSGTNQVRGWFGGSPQ